MNIKEKFIKSFFVENPVTVLLLGLCPTLATTTSAENGIGMGLATTFVLICSNVVISMLRNIIPNRVRIPAYIVVIATFVTIVDMSMQATVYNLHKTLGLFIPLIVVNCIILGRAEAFASKNSIGHSFLDGLFMGLGFTFALFILGSVREILGSGAWLGMQLIPESWSTILVFVLAPGAFLSLGFILVAMNKVSRLLEGGK
ncbi:RnfABCDGE type electron transport complex subunit E [Caldithrix abyssi]|uniref:Ion-translocating oxidoreductase complex subunit E n=1 Tax=Caldithrix abyssi DSM 13497 TaxID=880073 RepID=H1XPQ7_CALAY|nr:electron transport complex subunit E [Caldithrix abyssi]APF19881.1 electron transport complex protein RnfE [Caldithrix abyssi DSM 13497]EHO39978.1 electron transport complex, RnfABCDGE type, E subunit [Caldithrix abyssi DSM 13497]